MQDLWQIISSHKVSVPSSGIPSVYSKSMLLWLPAPQAPSPCVILCPNLLSCSLTTGGEGSILLLKCLIVTKIWLWQKFKVAGFEEDQDPKSQIEDEEQESQQGGHILNDRLLTDRWGGNRAQGERPRPSLGLPLLPIRSCVLQTGVGIVINPY